jgi:hypothetical protein
MHLCQQGTQTECCSTLPAGDVAIAPGQTKSRPDQGLIKMRTTTLNQNDEVFTVNVWVPRRLK